jgi:hypothetical protein
MLCGHILGLLIIVVLETLGYSWGQTIPATPCPDVFQYRVDAGGMWYGLISVPPPEPDFNIKLTVKMALDAIPPTVSDFYNSGFSQFPYSLYQIPWQRAALYLRI